VHPVTTSVSTGPNRSGTVLTEVPGTLGDQIVLTFTLNVP
jgi:hypothetical protein